jgi:hypothetical protein
MRRRGSVLLLAACFAAGTVADAAASPLPKRCESWFGPHVLALVCDPAARSAADVALDQVPGSEPYQDGERVTFDLGGGSPATGAAFRAATTDGMHRVVIAPFDPPARRYEVQIDGNLARVTADDGRTRALEIAPPASSPQVSSDTPAAAIRSFVSMIGSDAADLGLACGLLSSDARTAFDAYRALCPDLLGFVLFDQEVEPYYDLVSMRAGRVKLLRGRPAIAKVELLYRFDPDSRDDPRTLRVWAKTAVVEESGGWRVALPEVFSPRKALTGDSGLSRKQVRRHLRVYRREARRERARAQVRDRATRPVATGPTACPGKARSAADPTRDVMLADGGDLARRQDEAGVDLIGARHSLTGVRACFELRFRTPLASDASLALWLGDDAARIDISQSSAVASRDEHDEPRYFPAKVTVSAARDTISVEIDLARGWPHIERPFGWAVEAFRPLQAIDNGYFDELQP